MIQGGVKAEVVPILGMFALAAQKILPAIQQVYSSYSNIKGSRASFEDVLELLDRPFYHNTNKISSVGCIKFEKIIELKDLSFSYDSGPLWVLKDVNLKIKKGECVGFMGVTGGGKSTLIDIVMGLLNPTKGDLIVDGCVISNKNKNLWQAHITHVPQNIYLSNSTIEENIAFGIPKDKIDHQQVKIAAEQAQISDLISQWKDGYQTIIKERGANLSGGQRQRVGIARALYRKSDVLIFDEATSALDVQIEERIMDVINNLDKDLTILIIAHRLSTLKNCDKILEINKKGGIKLKKYEELYA
jgi:ATP-binding cassette subfamily B protein